jgi:hypothetical protein
MYTINNHYYRPFHLQDKKQKIERFTKETLKETQKHFHHTLVEQQQYL